MRTFILTYHM